MKARVLGVRAALPVVVTTEVVAIGAFIGLAPNQFGWWPAAVITGAAFVLMVATVHRRNLPGWIAALMRWRSRRRTRCPEDITSMPASFSPPGWSSRPVSTPSGSTFVVSDTVDPRKNVGV